MLRQVIEAVRQGGVVLTASQRLSRSLHAAYGNHQRQSGATVWATPDILPLSAWLRRCWSEASLASNESLPALLSDLQSEAVWRRIIEDSPEGRNLLQVSATAQKAMEAWRLVQDYR